MLIDWQARARELHSIFSNTTHPEWSGCVENKEVEVTTEQYQIGYEEGYQEGWNAAIGETPLYPALSAAPVGWKLVPVEPTQEMLDSPPNAWPADAKITWTAMLAASPTAEQQIKKPNVVLELPDGDTRVAKVFFSEMKGDTLHLCITVTEQAAPKAAPGVGNSGFDHQTAADFLNGKTVSDEAVRKFVQASRRAHDEKAALNAMLLSVRGVLASREAEIALLKKALMNAESAPQQEVQEPVATIEHTLGGSIQYCPLNEAAYKLPMGVQFKLYTAPQPAPLSDEQIANATGAEIGTPLFLAAKGFVLATEAAHGITKNRGSNVDT